MSLSNPVPRRVRDIMTVEPQSVRPSTPIAEAYTLMIQGGFRHLVVVVEGGEVVGMVSDRDILQNMPPPSRESSVEQGRFANEPVMSLMSQPALTIAPDEPIETAVDVMLAEQISALVVTTAQKRLLGVVTAVDLAKLAGALMRLLPPLRDPA